MQLEILCNRKVSTFVKNPLFHYIQTFMSADTRIRIVIIASLVAGHILVAILRSGTAW